MKNFIYNFFAVAVICLLAITAKAQTGYYIIDYSTDNAGNPAGISTDVDNANGGWSVIFSGSSTPQYTPVQTLPFSFKLNNAPVTQFKVSSTGYVTFDATATTPASSDNTALPSASLPNNTICVWGMEGTSTQYSKVMTKTFGVAPNRQLWIKYLFFLTPGTTQSYNVYSVVLEETTNRVFVVDQAHVVSSGSYSPVSLTVGIQINGSTAVQVTQSPNVAPQVSNGYGNADNDYYEFGVGTQLKYDFALLSINLPKKVKVNTAVDITGNVKNRGSETITSIDVNYQVNNETVKTRTISGVNIPPGGRYNFTHPTQWIPSVVAVFDTIKVWASNLNGHADEANNNDMLSGRVFVNNGVSAGKKVLVEEFSTAPCQYCPDGAVAIETIETNEGDAVIIAQHHAGFGTDKMTIQENSDYATAFTGGAPAAVFDRFYVSGDDQVASYDRSAWDSRAQTRMGEAAPVAVTVDKTYNPSTREINATVSASFVDYVVPGDLRINLFVTEDVVKGTGTGYDQVNAYNTVQGHPFFGKGNPVIGYEHKHVVRAVPSTSWGTAGIIPTKPAPNTATYSKAYTYTLPMTVNGSSVDENEIRLIGYVSYYDADVRNREVLNAIEVKLTPTSGVIDLTNDLTNGLSLYPTLVVHNELNIMYTVTEGSAVTLKINNLLGQTVTSLQENKFEAAGQHTLSQNISSLLPGTYYVTMSSNAKTLTRKFVVVK